VYSIAGREIFNANKARGSRGVSAAAQCNH
jgi:hypothetical protein